MLETQQPRLFANAYYPHEHDLRSRPIWTQAHRHRDVCLALDALLTLQPLGYVWSGVIANVAPGVLARLEPVEPPFRRGDLVFLVGRPPLDDESGRSGGLKRYTPRSDTPLEREIHQELRRVFRYCDRENVVLEVGLPDAARCFEHVIFFETKGGRIKRLGPMGARTRAPADPRLTVAYMICLPEVARRRYRLLVAFGAGGCETMILGQLLRDSWSETLRDIVQSDRPRLVLGTFRVPDWLPYPFLAYDPAQLDPRIVADVELP